MNQIHTFPPYFTKTHSVYFPFPRSFQRISPNPRPCVTFCNMLISYDEELLDSRQTPKMEDHPLSAVQYFRSCPLYLESISSIRNPKTGNSMVTETHPVRLRHKIPTRHTILRAGNTRSFLRNGSIFMALWTVAVTLSVSTYWFTSTWAMLKVQTLTIKHLQSK
jgi:hypothetical protein